LIGSGLDFASCAAPLIGNETDVFWSVDCHYAHKALKSVSGENMTLILSDVAFLASMTWSENDDAFYLCFEIFLSEIWNENVRRIWNDGVTDESLTWPQ
jgi:hypothetical protein